MNSINSTCDSWSPRWYENSSSLQYIVYCFLTEHWFTINISSKAPPTPCYNPDVHVFNGVITLAIVKQFREEKEEFLDSQAQGRGSPGVTLGQPWDSPGV